MAASPCEPGRVLLDPNTLSADGTVALNQLAVSEDGRLVAYATSAAGSDWMTWRVRDVGDGAGPARIWSSGRSSRRRGLAPDGVRFLSTRPWTGRTPGARTATRKTAPHGSCSTASAPARATTWSCSRRPTSPTGCRDATVSDDGRYLIISIHRGTSPETQVLVLDLDGAAGE